MKDNLKVLIYDIEIGPELALMYGNVYKPYIIKVVDYEYIMCFSYMWLGDKKIRHVSQMDFPARFKADYRDDYDLARSLRDLLDQADVAIAYNGKKFDNTMANTRIVKHNLDAPSPFRTVDPLATMRGQFHLPSNRLDDVAEFFGLKGKTSIKHGDLVHKCMDGCKKSWELEKKYCNQDVKVLHDVYQKILPYVKNHPNLALLSNRPDACPICGGSEFASKGWRYTNTSKYRRFYCRSHRGYFSERTEEKENYNGKQVRSYEKPTYTTTN